MAALPRSSAVSFPQFLSRERRLTEILRPAPTKEAIEVGAVIPSNYLGYDHITWYVSNAQQAASYFVARMGFSEIASRGFETGSKLISSHVVANGSCVFVFTSPLVWQLNDEADPEGEDETLWREIHTHLNKHGDGVKDMALKMHLVPNWRRERPSSKPLSLQFGDDLLASKDLIDAKGIVKLSTLKAFGDTTHTIVDRSGYQGAFLPGYQEVLHMDRLERELPPVLLEKIDYCVASQESNTLDEVTEWYRKFLGFQHRQDVNKYHYYSKYSAMTFAIMSSSTGSVQIYLNEPATGNDKSPVEEYVDFYHGSGVNHIALETNDIVTCVKNLRLRGVEFHTPLNAYYERAQTSLNSSRMRESMRMHLQTDLEVFEDLNILLDFDRQGYSLEAFTKPLGDRPIMSISFVQRYNYPCFALENFHSFFMILEREQAIRSILTSASGKSSGAIADGDRKQGEESKNGPRPAPDEKNPAEEATSFGYQMDSWDLKGEKE